VTATESLLARARALELRVRGVLAVPVLPVIPVGPEAAAAGGDPAAAQERVPEVPAARVGLAVREGLAVVAGEAAEAVARSIGRRLPRCRPREHPGRRELPGQDGARSRPCARFGTASAVQDGWVVPSLEASGSRSSAETDPLNRGES
jgi:hypothetical protein